MLTSFWSWMCFGLFMLCWVTLLIVWCAGVFYSILKTPFVLKQVRRFLAWMFGTMAVCFALFLSLFAFRKFLIFNVIWLQPIGLLLLLTSTIFTLWSRLVLGSMWTSLPTIKSGHILHTNGPYHVTRHPIYTGLLGMVIGSLLLYSSSEWFISTLEVLMVMELLIILQIKIVLEERVLHSAFGEQYVQFKEHVPQLIPLAKRCCWRIRPVC